MRLYLVQHGKAVPEEKDPHKPLSPEGRDETEKVAAVLIGKKLKADFIWHSTKMRSIQTAHILAQCVAHAGVKEREDLNPKDPVDKIAKEITELNKDIVIVGHLPFLQKLASKLLTGKDDGTLIGFTYSGIVCLDSEGSWKVSWMIVPELFP